MGQPLIFQCRSCQSLSRCVIFSVIPIFGRWASAMVEQPAGWGQNEMDQELWLAKTKMMVFFGGKIDVPCLIIFLKWIHRGSKDICPITNSLVLPKNGLHAFDVWPSANYVGELSRMIVKHTEHLYHIYIIYKPWKTSIPYATHGAGIWIHMNPNICPNKITQFRKYTSTMVRIWAWKILDPRFPSRVNCGCFPST